MEPLKVTFTIETPMRMPERAIHLDGLVAWAAVQEAGGDLSAQERLPLERREGEGDWCWAASRLLYRVESRFVQHMTRTFAPFEWGVDKGEGVFAGGPNKLPAGTGAYKAYQFHHPFGWVQRVEAYCIGDRERLGELLARIEHIGKLGRLDAGRVGKVSIEADEAARERCEWRTLPFERSGYRKTHATVRPPYWKRQNRVVAFEAPPVVYDRSASDWNTAING